ncbi:MAG: lysophospholipid acyltransferase family protein [Bacillota bacterium]|nr:lysophospholipid acyltransferase family protein [Bacillota bacterium]
MNKENTFKKKLIKEDIFYRIMMLIIRPFLPLRYNITKKNSEILHKDKPYLIIGNHVMAEDPVIINSHSNKLIRYIASDTNYDTYWKKVILNLGGAIPFSKGNSDIKAVKHLLRLTRANKPVGLYPEGGRCWSGETEEIIYSTAKLIKMLGIPVYKVIIKGGYLKKPRWAQYYRKGKTYMDYEVLFNTSQIKKMSEKEIYIKMKNGIYHNEYKWQRENKIEFKGKNKAEHIERLIYICPKCKSIDSIHSHGDKFKCKSCNEEWMIDRYGFIKGNYFKDTVEWNNWQKDLLYKDLDLEKINIITREINLKKFNIEGEKIVDEKVNIKLNSKYIQIIGNSIDEKLNLENIKAVSITLLDIFEFYNNKEEKYRIIFNPKSNPSIILFLETIKYYIRRRKNER